MRLANTFFWLPVFGSVSRQPLKLATVLASATGPVLSPEAEATWVFLRPPVFNDPRRLLPVLAGSLWLVKPSLGPKSRTGEKHVVRVVRNRLVFALSFLTYSVRLRHDRPFFCDVASEAVNGGAEMYRRFSERESVDGSGAAERYRMADIPVKILGGCVNPPLFPVLRTIKFQPRRRTESK